MATRPVRSPLSRAVAFARAEACGQGRAACDSHEHGAAPLLRRLAERFLVDAPARSAAATRPGARHRHSGVARAGLRARTRGGVLRDLKPENISRVPHSRCREPRGIRRAADAIGVPCSTLRGWRRRRGGDAGEHGDTFPQYPDDCELTSMLRSSTWQRSRATSIPWAGTPCARAHARPGLSPG